MTIEGSSGLPQNALHFSSNSIPTVYILYILLYSLHSAIFKGEEDLLYGKQLRMYGGPNILRECACLWLPADLARLFANLALLNKHKN